jgi:hypothetical protein
MKKLIFLKQEWLETKGMKKSEISEAEKEIFQKSVKSFVEQLKSMGYKILKEISPNSIIIEYDDALDEQTMAALQTANIVEIIDSMVPGNI